MTLSDWDCGVTGKGNPRWVVERHELRRNGRAEQRFAAGKFFQLLGGQHGGFSSSW